MAKKIIKKWVIYRASDGQVSEVLFDSKAIGVRILKETLAEVTRIFSRVNGSKSQAKKLIEDFGRQHKVVEVQILIK